MRIKYEPVLEIFIRTTFIRKLDHTGTLPFGIFIFVDHHNRNYQVTSTTPTRRRCHFRVITGTGAMYILTVFQDGSIRYNPASLRHFLGLICREWAVIDT
jgi:hypothetical protein